ncbi:MAG: excinuclease ABC subunit UvrC [Bacteroidales bacterium]
MSSLERLREMASEMPGNPGVYLFSDRNGTILYIGKAKNLRKRVLSYFVAGRSGKTALLLKRSYHIGHSAVTTESEALLLENNLIKKHQPRYNILLKDDKTFPWICIKDEPFPRVFMTRTVVDDGSQYFGPYTSVVMVKTLLSLVRQLFSLRNCKLNLTPGNISGGKFRVCLEYQIGNCKGPCEGLQSQEDYDSGISQIREILRGNIRTVTDHLKELMLKYSLALKFEDAQKIKEKLEMLSRYRARSLVVNPATGNADVFGFSMEGDYAAVNFMRIIEGAVVQTFTIGLKRQMDENREMMLSLAVGEIVNRIGPLSPVAIVPFIPDFSPETVRFTVPLKGDKKRLLEMAERNAIWFRLEQKKKAEGKTAADRTDKNLERLKNDLHMSKLPRHIECFDNSNIQGANPVASCVVFRNGKPSRSEYRHFNIRSVSGPDDYASMAEVVLRRYKRILQEGGSLPDLIVIDGGKGQLSSALESLSQLGIRDRISVIGIAKRLEEIYFPGDPVPLYIDKNAVSLKIIQNIRNEAHRFGISFHRLRRSNDMVSSELENIPGVGEKTATRLLRRFGSVHAIKEASEEEIASETGKVKALAIKKHLGNA